MMTPRLILLMASATLLMVPLFTAQSHAKNPNPGPNWSPSVTERLVKLPQSHLKKSVDRDFARSPLADAIANTNEDIKLKTQTLDDLRRAAEQADGDLQIELRHQLLAEKNNYLQLVKKHQDLRRRHLQKRKTVYTRILEKHMRAKGAGSPELTQLIERQEKAHARFRKSEETVDMKVFANFDAPQSKYAGAYAQNLSAANALLAAINKHPTRRINSDADPKDKTDFLRRLVADADSELALINQEGQIVGYMAKLVALDAAAFSEQIASDDVPETESVQQTTISSALNHFIQ